MHDSPRPDDGRAPARAALTLLTLLAVVTGAGVLTALAALPVVGGAALVANRATDRFLGTRCDVVLAPTQQTTRILASDGRTVLARLFDQNRRDVPLSAVPRSVQQALVATEDRRFYQHHGVDLRGLVRAALHDGSGGGTQGGSTLTMQLVKQLRSYEADTPAQQRAAVEQSVERKLRDAKCALELEKRFGKATLLQDYLNIAYFGENAYGIEVAAETYFGKPAAKLTVPEGAMLVGLLRSPGEYDPFHNAEAARHRRDAVLQNMAEMGAVSRAQAAKYARTPVRLASTTPPTVAEGCVNATPTVANAGFFCDYAVSWLQQHGIALRTLRTGGLSVVTTLDARLQDRGQRAVWASGLKATSPTVLVMPSVDPRSGAVQTMISSRHYGVNAKRGETMLPLFTRGVAGAGSTYKLFTTLAALELGMPTGFTLRTGSNAYTVRHCPLGPNGAAQPYTTHNVGDYSPTLALKDALPQSVNTYFVGLEDQFFGCDLRPIVQMALRLGMDGLNRPEPGSATTISRAVVAQHQAGFTLGFSPTSPLELAGAYATVAADGVHCPPVPVVKVTRADGAPVPFSRPKCTRAISVQTARTAAKLLTADTTDPQGTASRYFGGWYGRGGSLVASKTGTDNDLSTDEKGGNSALWFVGVTPHLTSAAALINPTSPKATISGLPDSVTSDGSDVFGAYASTFWLDAYAPALVRDHWTWADPAAVPGSVPVPDVIGRSAGEATARLKAAGFAAVVATTRCGSPKPPGQVGYFAPHTAPRGTTVTLCLSNGETPDGYYAQFPPPPAPVRRSAPAPKPVTPVRPTPPPPPHRHKPRH